MKHPVPTRRVSDICHQTLAGSAAMIERRDQADSVGRHSYRPSSPLATAVGLMLCLTLALTQPSVGTVASASLEFMGLHPGMTLDPVEQALEKQGLALQKLSLTPARKSAV